MSRTKVSIRPPLPRRRAAVHLLGRRRAALARGPVWTTRPCRARPRRARRGATTPRFCSTSSDRRDLGRPARARVATSVTSSGASPFVGSSIEQHPVVVQERAGDRDHLLLAAGERPGALLPRARAARGRARRRGRSARSPLRSASSQVLLARSARRRRRGPRARSRRRAGRSGASASRVDLLAARAATVPARVDEPEERAERRRLADAVAAEQRGDAALRHVEARRPAGRASPPR